MNLQSTIVVKFINPELGVETFQNAEAVLVQPGIFVIQNPQGRLALYPVGAVASINFPDGPPRIQEVSL